MAGGTSNDSSSSSMSPAVSSPSSSLVYIDLYGKRRHVAKIQVLDREIGLLQDEIKSLVQLEPASTCCKELDGYVEATPDPLIAINRSSGKSRSFWKNLGRKFGSMICCRCCNTKFCCTCFPGGKECCCGGRKKTCSPGCCNCLACSCSCNPRWPKCLVCCCCKSCSCF